MTHQFTREDITFKANGLNLSGWLYQPESKNKMPAIIMAHGYSCVKELYLDRYAEVFAKAGFVVLAYDHRNFGDSEAVTEREIDPQAQVADWRDAITFMQTLPFVDDNQIGIWGTSLAGGHVLVVGALDKRVKCIVSLVPTISGSRNIARRIPIDKLETLNAEFKKERIRIYQGEKAKTVPVLSDELLKQPFNDNRNDYRALFDSYYAPQSEQWRFRNVKNFITLLSLENYANYNPEMYLNYISPTPILMIVAEHDTVTMTEDELHVYSQLNEPKALKIIKGGHFTAYHEGLDDVANASLEWFKRWLIVS